MARSESDGSPRPRPHAPPTGVLALVYVTKEGMEDTFAILRSHPGTPRRYSWVSATYGPVDLYSVVGTVRDDGEPEVVELKWSITPVDPPRYADALGRRIFALSPGDPRSLHREWRCAVEPNDA
jgi:hypothetical protein